MKEQEQTKKCNRKCVMCQHRDKKINFCKEKNKDCTSTDTDFSKCDSYLVADRLSMF